MPGWVSAIRLDSSVRKSISTIGVRGASGSPAWGVCGFCGGVGGSFTARFFLWVSPVSGLVCERSGRTLLDLLTVGRSGSASGSSIGWSVSMVCSLTISMGHSSQSGMDVVVVWFGVSVGGLTKNRRSNESDSIVGANAMILRSESSGPGPFRVLPIRFRSWVEPHG